MTKFEASALLQEFDHIAAKMTAQDKREVQKFSDVKKTRRLIHPFLYLLVEVKARELHPKAIIARQAAEQGLNVLIGASWPIMFMNLPPGIMFFKTMNRLDAYNMWVYLQKNGHQFAAMDEEIFGIAPTARYIAATTHPYAAAFADVICAQGRNYAAAFPYPAKVRVTGTPRTLVYRPSKGDDILVCLQSGNINNNGRTFATLIAHTLQLSPQHLATKAGKDWVQIARSSIAHECKVLPLVLETINALADAFPNRRIRIRPHPVENPNTWTFARSNVVMDTSDTIVSALETVGTLVYVSGCTTGLDAHLAGVPAVRLGSGGHGISARMHVEANTPEEAVAAVRRNALWTGNIDNHLAKLDMVSHLLPLYRDNPAGGAVQLNTTSTFKPEDFHHRKFPETTVEEMEMLVGLPVEKVGWNAFLVRAVSRA